MTLRPLLAGKGLSFDLQIHIPQMPMAVALVREYADLQFVLNHAGFPYVRDDDDHARWADGMAALAVCPNVAVKISGLGMCDHDAEHRISVRGCTSTEIAVSILPTVRAVLELFGAERTMFASNFPVDKLTVSYEALYAAYFSLARDLLTPEERPLVFASTAERIYRL